MPLPMGTLTWGRITLCHFLGDTGQVALLLDPHFLYCL